MTTKTYGVDGLLEWHISIAAGSLHINIEFTDGKISGYGISPAIYKTSDPVLQQAIERSPQFKSGRIRIVSVKRNPSENSPIRRKNSSKADSREEERKIIDVPDWNSARLQLMRLTGLPGERLQTRAEMEEAAKTHNIELRPPSPR